MTAFNNYLTSEVVEDYSDGIISRREALRRLGLLGVGAAVALPLLAACDAAAPDWVGLAGCLSTADESGRTRDSGRTDPTADRGDHLRRAEAAELQAAWAEASDPRGTVLVIHENRGLTDHIRSVAGRLAASGYSALALDLLSEEGGTGSFPGEAEVQAALNAAPDDRFVADMKAALGELEQRAPDAKIGAVGFCFGGGMVWTLLASGEPRLSAAAPFYGPLPDGADFSGSANAAVLGVYAEQDERVNASRDAATAALEAAGLTHEIVTYPNAGHAFFNDTGQRYNPEAAASAYEKLTGWFETHLA